jgi:hypothetical protein
LLLFPLGEGSFWPAYRISVDLPLGSFSFVNLNGSYLNRENLPLNLINGITEVPSSKVKFDLDIQRGINLTPKKFTAFAWVTDEIGIVKLMGSSVILGFLLTGEFNFDDSTKTITQDIYEYEIK